MNSRIPGLLTHAFKGSRGWSIVKATAPLDVAHIELLVPQKRLFKIFDSDKPYKLNVWYGGPRSGFDILPTLFGFLTVDFHSRLITLRYPTERAMMVDINQVLLKQEDVDLIRQQILEKASATHFKGHHDWLKVLDGIK